MARTTNPPLPPGRRLQPFLIAACVERREQSGSSRERIADLAGVTFMSVRRFERGETFPGENLERYLAAYAHPGDGRDVLEEALQLWRGHGYRPLTIHEKPTDGEQRIQDLMVQIRRAGEIDRAHAQAEAQPTSIRRKRANDPRRPQ